MVTRFKIILSLFLIIFLTSCEEKEVLNVGDYAPNFSLDNGKGKQVALKDLKGSYSLIFFFGRIDNSGTVEHLTKFKNTFQFYQEKNIKLIGVSHVKQKLIDKKRNDLRLPFLILSDNEKQMIKEYKIPTSFGAAKRISFLIDKNGIIQSIIEEKEVREHHNVLKLEIEKIAQ